MARQIIILGKNPAGWPGANTIHAVFWIPVTAGQEEPLPNFSSSVVGSTEQPDGTELAALRNGTVREYVSYWNFPNNYSAANVRTFLEAAYLRAVADFSPPGQFYGAKWDGSSWTA